MNVLFLTHRLPFAPNRGDRVRAYHIMRHLQARARVQVVSLVHDAGEAAEADTLRGEGIAVDIARVPRLRNHVRGLAALRSATPLTHVLLDAPDVRAAIDAAVARCRPDVVLAYCSGMARFALDAPLARVPLVIDLVDVDSAKWSDFAARSAPPRRWIYQREAQCLAAFEGRAAAKARAVTVVNAREAEALARFAPHADVRIVPNGVDLQHLAPAGGPAVAPTVIFTAVFDYAPNAEGAVWFAREVWPIVTRRVPQARLVLAGASPTRAVRALGENPSIQVTGSVPDMRPWLWRSAVAIAPLFLARGVQNKVLEAAAAGLPSVVTPAVWNGLPAEVLPACRSAADADAFAAATIELLQLAPAARRNLAQTADLSALRWSRRLDPLVDLLDEAAGGRALASLSVPGPQPVPVGV